MASLKIKIVYYMADIILSNSKNINIKIIDEVIHITYTYVCRGYARHAAYRVAVVMPGRIAVVSPAALSWICPTCFLQFAAHTNE